jgi:hypothetical protein
MKIKNFVTFTIFVIITFSPLSSETIFPKEVKPDISRYLNYNKPTPVQLSSYNMKQYFASLYNTNFYGMDIKSISKSKTSIFNQSLTEYIKEMYNNKYYAHFLSQDGSHIIQFLELGNEINLGIEALYAGIRLFYNKIKTCELIDDTVLLQVIAPMPILLEKFFSDNDFEFPECNMLSRQTEELLLAQFTEHMDIFNEEPNLFLNEISMQIGKLTKEEFDILEKMIEEKEMTQRLQNLVIRFLEIALSKVMWDHTSYESIWESILTIANSIQMLGVNGIIEYVDDLDDIFWSLTYRFCYFLDLVGSGLPTSFHENIENDIDSGVIFFLELPEQDEGIKSKKQILKEALLKAKIKAIAFEKRGLFTDQAM